MTLLGLLKIGTKALWTVCFGAACLGNAGFGELYFLFGEYFLAISIPVSLWYLKVDSTDSHMVTR